MAASAGMAIFEAFGPSGKDARDLISQFDFSDMIRSTSTSKEFLKFDLAPSFGKLDAKSIKLIDDELKIVIAAATKTIASLSDKSWRNVVAALKQYPGLEPDGDEVHRSDKLMKESTNVFKFDGSADNAIVQEVKSWFTNLIKDQDILDSTQIDIEGLASVVASTGARVDSIQTVFLKSEHREQTLLEIGVLRYPDIDNPFFKVYRIKLTAWSDCGRFVMVQKDQNGIVGEITVQKFKPRSSVISNMRKEIQKKAVDEAEALFL